MRIAYSLLALVLAATLSACGGDPSSDTSTSPVTTAAFSVGGTVSGLRPNGTLMVANVAPTTGKPQSTNLTVNGPYALTFERGAAYDLRVVGQPLNQTCALNAAQGTANGDVSNINITCTDILYQIGGQLSGNIGSVTVRNTSNNDTLALASDGKFAFKPVPAGSAYDIEVINTTDGQGCTVTNKSGTVTAEVSNILVSCSPAGTGIGGGTGSTGGTTPPPPPTTYAIKATVSGLSGDSVVLQNNAGNSLTVSADGTFAFPDRLVDHASYSVTAMAITDVGRVCSVSNGVGSVAGADVNVQVTCSIPPAPTYTIGGNVSGLPLNGSVTLSLISNSTNVEALTLTADGNFQFVAREPSASSYTVFVSAQSLGTGCTIDPSVASGLVPVGGVANVLVKCAAVAVIF